MTEEEERCATLAKVSPSQERAWFRLTGVFLRTQEPSATQDKTRDPGLLRPQERTEPKSLHPLVQRNQLRQHGSKSRLVS
ncbi:hypothetical protein EV292_105209 [Sphingomonas sp. BK235]|nr:hypothetical protein EV292_105209 [Sphingomonas sp. BK235]